VFNFRIEDVEHETDLEEELKSIESKEFVLKYMPSNYTVHFPIMFKLAKKLELVSMQYYFLTSALMLMQNKLECLLRPGFFRLVSCL
jgi:hypothetical protein